MKGRDRNKPCVCGSGKKWKKCHPDRDEFYVEPIGHLTNEERRERAKNIRHLDNI